MKVLLDNCNGCAECLEVCPTGAVTTEDRKAIISKDLCLDCNACFKVCKFKALEKLPEEEALPAGMRICRSCPIYCHIEPGKTGSCARYINENGILYRKMPPKTPDEVKEWVGEDHEIETRRPLITAIGAGTTSPCYKPAPYIVQDKVNGVDVVTSVTECIYSITAMEVEIDADMRVGEEGADVIAGRNRVIGKVRPPIYGTQVLYLGGGEMLTTHGAVNGFTAAQVMVDLANRKRVDLRVRGGRKFSIQVGKHPIIDGEEIKKTRFGCGGATCNVLGGYFIGAADEVVVVDYLYTGLWSEFNFNQWDRGVVYSGLKLAYDRNTPGRYYGVPGPGWGLTDVEDPLQLIKPSPDMKKGATVLVTEPTGQKAKLYRYLGDEAGFDEIKLTPEANRAVQAIGDNTGEATVSAVIIATAGGSARGGTSTRPMKLTEAIKSRKARVTVGGAPAFVHPSFNIYFRADVERVMPGAFSWVPSPAVVIPTEFTMTLEDYIDIGGYVDAIRPLSEVLKEIKQGKRHEVPELGW